MGKGIELKYGQGCPEGFIFGEACDEDDACDKCDIYDACDKAETEHLNKEKRNPIKKKNIHVREPEEQELWYKKQAQINRYERRTILRGYLTDIMLSGEALPAKFIAEYNELCKLIIIHKEFN